MTTLTITGIPAGLPLGGLVRELADIAAQHGLVLKGEIRDGGQVLRLVPTATVGAEAATAAPERACRVIPFPVKTSEVSGKGASGAITGGRP